jgi:hypothetical protein
MNKLVAVDLDKNGEFTMCELVSVNKGWVTVIHEGAERKVRVSQVALDANDNVAEEVLDDILTDEGDLDLDEDGNPVKRGDVFPRGIRETYVKGKTPTGKTYIDCGDEIAEQLRGMDLNGVAEVAAQVLGQLTAEGWIAVYREDRIAAGKNPLNPGMIRMNLGNRIRAAVKAQEQEAQGEAA